ncbi:MAG: aminotransferase class I/II-fold pyridoxal phosphate-dependent enzyme [Lentisphaerae bacterium]|nr:aminotransferase class I/II-fold pyridoxal phosphate-dependent enzyme [Lentisphaerota bacterium]MBR2719917.1 aminotransferase class I/II-fold pyridoxal phosphate-dependent enzyme [Lentisphaeria bacterium]
MSGSKSVSEKFIAPHIASLPASGIRKFFDLVNAMDDVISLGVGEPDFVTPWTIRESGIYSLEHGHTGYTSNLGMPRLRRAICDYVEKNYSVSYDYRNECLVTIGVSEALDLAFRMLLSPGDEVIYTEPCYVSYPAEIAMAHGVPVPVTTRYENEFAVEPEDIERAVTPRTKAILLNFPCNPTGAVMPPEKLRAVAEIAKKYDLAVLTDEIYSELNYDGNHLSIASLPGMKERTIFLHGFSKAFAMTGWRVGYVCAPAAMISAMMRIHQYAIMCAPTVAQEAALEAVQNGGNAMVEMRESYRSRRDFFVKGLNDAGLECLMPHGAFYAFASVKNSGMDSAEFAEKLLCAEHVAVVPGEAFGPGGKGFVRCCYATSADELREALKRIKRFMDKQGSL